ncbi:MAG: cell division protein FtsL [Candidatus Latescibacterota bacterium]
MISAAQYKRAQPSIRHNRLMFFLLVFVATVLAVFFISEDVYILSLGKEIQKTKKERELLEIENVSLKLKAAELRKGSRIKTIAHDNLGMVMPVGAPRKLF